MKSTLAVILETPGAVNMPRVLGGGHVETPHPRSAAPGPAKTRQERSLLPPPTPQREPAWGPSSHPPPLRGASRSAQPGSQLQPPSESALPTGALAALPLPQGLDRGGKSHLGGRTEGRWDREGASSAASASQGPTPATAPSGSGTLRDLACVGTNREKSLREWEPPAPCPPACPPACPAHSKQSSRVCLSQSRAGSVRALAGPAPTGWSSGVPTPYLLSDLGLVPKSLASVS